MRLHRMTQAGAIWADNLQSLPDLRDRYDVTGVAMVQSPFGAAPSFDGVGDVVVVGDLSAHADVQSISFWVYSATDTEPFIDLDGGTHYVDVNAGTVRAVGWAAPTIYVDGAAATTLTALVWHHVAVTTATGFVASNVQLATDDAQNFGEIRLRDVVIWPRALSAVEVADLATHEGW